MTEPSNPPGNDGMSEPVAPATPTIQLDQFLKTCGVETGGQAKLLIQGGEILLNGEVKTRRRKKLTVGDEVEWDGTVFVVSWGGDEADE